MNILVYLTLAIFIVAPVLMFYTWGKQELRTRFKLNI